MLEEQAEGNLTRKRRENSEGNWVCVLTDQGKVPQGLSRAGVWWWGPEAARGWTSQSREHAGGSIQGVQGSPRRWDWRQGQLQHSPDKVWEPRAALPELLAMGRGWEWGSSGGQPVSSGSWQIDTMAETLLGITDSWESRHFGAGRWIKSCLLDDSHQSEWEGRKEKYFNKWFWKVTPSRATEES